MEKITSKRITKTVVKQWVKFFTIVAVVVAALYAVFSYVPYFANRKHYVIISGSMAPTIQIGDIAIINTDFNIHELEVGDIIAFYANLDMVGDDEIVVHTIADIKTDEQGKITMRTMRENDNPQKIWDTWVIEESYIIGKYDFRIMYIGRFFLFAESAFGKGILIADILIFYLIYDILQDEKRKKNRITLKKGKKILKDAEKKLIKNNIVPSAINLISDEVLEVLFSTNQEEFCHGRRVSEYCLMIGKEMKMSENELQKLRIAALLHDIGKVEINTKILNKETHLLKREKTAVQKHAYYGYQILSSVEGLKEIAKIVAEHHEQWDGNGYPKRIKGENISIYARIISVADAYDVMISERAYKKADEKQNAVEELKRCAGTQFDPVIAGIFVNQVYQNALK